MVIDDKVKNGLQSLSEYIQGEQSRFIIDNIYAGRASKSKARELCEPEIATQAMSLRRSRVVGACQLIQVGYNKLQASLDASQAKLGRVLSQSQAKPSSIAAS